LTVDASLSVQKSPLVGFSALQAIIQQDYIKPVQFNGAEEQSDTISLN